MQKKYERKVLIVGAGLAGSTIARILADNNIKVQIIEKRNHIAGNIFDCVNMNNERIHKYGPHFLHCNKKEKALLFLINTFSIVKKQCFMNFNSLFLHIISILSLSIAII